MMLSVKPLYTTFVVLLLLVSSSDAFFGRKKYTPIIFFKVPPDLIPECDEMSKSVKAIAKELGVRVDQMDAARDPNVAAFLSLLTQGKNPPLLYHRESLQMVTANEKGRIRALMKGRFLGGTGGKQKGTKGGAAKALVVDDDAALEQQDLMEDQMLTPLQRKGKQAIRERTKEKGESRKAIK